MQYSKKKNSNEFGKKLITIKATKTITINYKNKNNKTINK